MDTIKNYLENMFINLPQTPEVLKAKERLLEMMEDKYNELLAEGKREHEAIGIVISEFGNIEELAQELGIWDMMQNSHRYSFSEKADAEDESFAGGSDENAAYQYRYGHETGNAYENARYVSGEEIDTYMELVQKSSGRIGAGVFLCICSPVLLLLLGGLSECFGVLTEDAAGGLGVCALLILIAGAVALFITTGMKLDDYNRLKKESFFIDEQQKQLLFALRAERKGMFTVKIVIGVMLCILSVLPVIVTGIIASGAFGEFLCVSAVCFMLIMVSVAVFLFITAGMEKEFYKIILQEQEYTPQNKRSEDIVEKVASVYWTLVTALYLAWSFLGGHWEYTWIIWPVAGVLFGAVSGIIHAVVGKGR